LKGKEIKFRGHFLGISKNEVLRNRKVGEKTIVKNAGGKKKVV